METPKVTVKRRNFCKQTMALALSFSAGPVMAGFRGSNQPANDALPAEMVHEFVAAAHVNLDKVKEMLAKEPNLANACWDWGGETLK